MTLFLCSPESKSTCPLYNWLYELSQLIGSSQYLYIGRFLPSQNFQPRVAYGPPPADSRDRRRCLQL